MFLLKKNILWGRKKYWLWSGKWNKVQWILLCSGYMSLGSLSLLKEMFTCETKLIHAKRRYWAPSQSNHPEWSSLSIFPHDILSLYSKYMVNKYVKRITFKKYTSDKDMLERPTVLLSPRYVNMAKSMFSGIITLEQLKHFSNHLGRNQVLKRLREITLACERFDSMTSWLYMDIGYVGISWHL